MRVKRRNFLALTSAGLASTLISNGVWSVEAAGLAAEQVTVNSIKSFSKAIKEAKAGDTIVIANGRYSDWSAKLDCKGTAKRPITIRPESTGGVVFTGQCQFSLTGSYINVDGLRFDGCVLKSNLLEFRQSDHCQITGCLFKNSGGIKRAAIAITVGSTNNSVTDCRFENIEARCVNLALGQGVTENNVPTGNVIARNHFQDIPSIGGNGRETVKIGNDMTKHGHIVVAAVVEDNTFVRCNGEAEIISNKCAGNIYRRNVFHDCDGELVMRGGQNCLIERNQFFGGKGGIRICGTGHIVKDNLIVNSKNTGIRLYYGMTKGQSGHYQAAGNCLIVNNTIVNAGRVGIFVGDRRGADQGEKGIQNVAPEGNQLLNNIVTGTTGDLFLVDHAPENRTAGNFFFLQGDAVVSSPGDDPIYGDPLFRDPKSGDFRPRQGGLALKSDPVKGASLSGLSIGGGER